jgi:D-inositol-3-phosphate glycosyltransferase
VRWRVSCVPSSRLLGHIAHTLGLVKNRTLATGAPPEPALRIHIEGEIAQQADLLVASTNDEASELANLYHADPECIHVVEPGVDLRMFQPINRAEARLTIGYGRGRLLLFVGRLERLKGVEVAIRALAFPRDRGHHEVRLLVLGEDSRNGSGSEVEESEKERLKAIATSLGVRDRVVFLCSVAHHELPYFYGAADVCVMPSYSESFGLVALEAQACGRPVVGSGVSGFAQWCGMRSADICSTVTIPICDAERIGRLLDHRDLAEQMGRHGRLLAQRFSWTRTADRLEDLFERVIGQVRSRPTLGTNRGTIQRQALSTQSVACNQHSSNRSVCR